MISQERWAEKGMIPWEKWAEEKGLIPWEWCHGTGILLSVPALF